MSRDPCDLFQAYPESEWHEDIGDVLWWRLPISEPPYCGGPTDLGYTVEFEIEANSSDRKHSSCKASMMVGGWPFTDDDLPNLVWTMLPGSIRMPK